MADKEISELTVAGALTGAELLHVVQSSNSRQTTLQQVVALVGGAGSVRGLVMSNNGTDGDHDIDVAVGFAFSDDTSNPVLMNLSTAITKRFDALFAEGDSNGAMLTDASQSPSVDSTLPADGVVNVWIIAKSDGTVDVAANNHAVDGFDIELPSGFSYKQYIGSLLTDSSNNIEAFTQSGDYLELATPKLAFEDIDQDVGDTDTRTLPVPLGLNLPVRLEVNGGNENGPWYVSVYRSGHVGSTPSEIDFGVDSGTGTIGHRSNGLSGSAGGACVLDVLTNTSGQIVTKNGSLDDNCHMGAYVVGYTLPRGRLGEYQ